MEESGETVMKSVVFCPAQSRHETTLLPLFRSQRKTSTKEGSSIARVWGSYHLRRLQCVIIKKGGKVEGIKKYPKYENKAREDRESKIHKLWSSSDVEAPYSSNTLDVGYWLVNEDLQNAANIDALSI